MQNKLFSCIAYHEFSIFLQKKMFKGGKIIINDRFNLNGTLVK